MAGAERSPLRIAEDDEGERMVGVEVGAGVQVEVVYDAGGALQLLQSTAKLAMSQRDRERLVSRVGKKTNKQAVGNAGAVSVSLYLVG